MLHKCWDQPTALPDLALDVAILRRSRVAKDGQSVYEHVLELVEADIGRIAQKMIHQCVGQLRRGREEIFGEFDRRFEIQEEIKLEGEKKIIDRILLLAMTALEKTRMELFPEIEQSQWYGRRE